MWLKPQGYATIHSPVCSKVNLDNSRRDSIGEGESKYDTMTCAHCNCVKHVKAKERPEDLGGLCKQCMGLICAKCLDKPCMPFIKKIELMEERDRRRREYGA